MIKRLFAVKPVESLIQEAHQECGLKRTLTATDIILLGIGVIVGTGIFVLTGHAAASNAGPAISVSFIIAGFAAALAGLCYGEMAAMIPIAGSAYTYAYATIGELGAYLIGWDLILEYLIGAATVSAGWSGYLVAFVRRVFGVSLSPVWTLPPLVWDSDNEKLMWSGSIINLPAVLFSLVVGLTLLLGIKESARINAVIVSFKLLAIGLFLFFAISHINPDNWQPFLPVNTGTFGHFGFSGLLQGATLVFFAYIGFDAVSTVAQECRQPQRDLPLGMLIALLICTTLYVLVSLVLTGLVPYFQLSVPHPIAIGVQKIGIPWLEAVVDLGAMCGLTSGAMVMLVGQPRIFYAMAKDGLFPRFALITHRRFHTPYLTTLLTSSLCALVGGLCPIDILGEMTSIGTLFAFVLVSLSVMIMRLQQPDRPRAFRVPFGPYVIPLGSAITSGLLITTATNRSLIRLVTWMIAGCIVYWLYGYKHSRLGKQRPTV